MNVWFDIALQDKVKQLAVAQLQTKGFILFFCIVEQTSYVNIQYFCDFVQSNQVRLNIITAPFTDSTIWFAQLSSKPFASLATFHKHNF